MTNVLVAVESNTRNAVDHKLLKAVDALIEKYSQNSLRTGVCHCPLCSLYFNEDCLGCPNLYFRGYLGCVTRSVKYSNLDYDIINNYPTLKAFWEKYKELYLEGQNNEEIMSVLEKTFGIEYVQSCIK